jgi:hypothetical protein
MVILAILLALLIGNAMALFVLAGRLKRAERGVLYARGAAQEFCRLTGDSHRLLGRVSDVWESDPELLAKTLSSLTGPQQKNIKVLRERGVIREHTRKIEEMTGIFSEFVGQTPLPSEVGIHGTKQRS